MVDRSRRHPGRLAVALLVAGVALLLASAVALAATAKPAKVPRATTATKATKATKHAAPVLPPLVAWPASAVAFPQRAIIVQPPARFALTPGAISLSEDGKPVTSFTLSPLAAGHAGDFGTVLAIDRNTSMGGAGLSAVLAAARKLAAARPGAQQLGVVTFDSRASRYLPLTADPATIAQSLFIAPSTGAGADASSAESLALDELAAAHLAAGMVIVVSDGVGVSPVAAAPAARTAAQAAHIPVITVGVADAQATPSSLRTLAAQAPGPYVVSSPATLPAVVATLERRAVVGDVLRYRSDAPVGQPAAIHLAIKGLGGNLSYAAAYAQPAAPAPKPAAPTSAPQPAVAMAPAVKPAPPVTPRNPRAGLSFSSSFAPRDTLASAPAFPATGPAPAADPAPAPAPAVEQGFWGSSTAALAVAISCGLLVAAILLLILRRPSHRAVRLRVGSFIPTEAEAEDPLVTAGSESRAKGPLTMLARRDWWPAFVESVEVSRSAHTPIYLVKRAAAIGMVLAVITTLVVGSVFAGFICLIAWPFILRLAVNRAAEKQRAKFRDSLPVYLQDLSSAIRVGRSLVGGLSVLTENAEEPMRSELERAITDEALGRPLEESLEAVGKRMVSNDMDQVALIAALNRRSGSNIAEALDRVAEGARERADLRREIRALTAQAKLSSLVLTALPGVLLVGLSLISPEYSHPLFHTTAGIIAVCVGGVLVIAGWKVMQKITRVEA